MSKLVDIACENWPTLRDMYKIDWPVNHIGYYTVDNYVRWIERDPSIKHLKFYSLDDDWSDGTFLVVDRYQLFLNSLNPSNGRLETALDLLDWKHGYKISSFLQRHRSAVVNVVDRRKLKKEYDSHTVLYYLTQEDAKKFELSHSDEFIIKPMVESDAKTADDLWPNKHQGSLFFLKRLINWNPNIGIYTKAGRLVAWCFRLQAGPLGALQVIDSYKRQGLGTLATMAMSKKLAEMGQDTFALVNEQNLASRKMFEKLGFRLYDDAYWLRTYPVGDFEWSDD